MPSTHNLLALLSMLAGVLIWQILIVGLVSIIRQQINRLLKSLSLIGGVCLIVYGLGAWVSAAQIMV